MRVAPALLGLLLSSLLASSLPVQAAENLSGEWTVSSPLWALPHVCTFRQAGGTLTGSCTGPHAQGDVRGRVNGQGVTFGWHGDRFNDHTVIVWQFSGRMEADVIRGTVLRGRQRGTFVARRPVGLS